jgi:hypothetical protein
MASGTNDSDDTPKESAPEPEPPKISAKGMAAMQGTDDIAESAHDWHTGRPAEIAAIEKIRKDEGRGIDLNSAREGGNPNFPLYDVAGPDTVASVKHLGQEDGDKLSEATLTNYRGALREAIGIGADPEKFKKAAEGLSKLSDEGKPVPVGLRDNPLDYLRDHAQLWAPEDHAYKVKEDLNRRFHSKDDVTREVTANQYGLNHKSETYTQDVADLLDRIKPIPKTSSELNDEFSRKDTRGL